MGRRHQTKKTDTNQKDIVTALRMVPGISVETDKDDILVGWRGRTYWYEIKNPEKISKAGKEYKRKETTQRKQETLDATWTGHYKIVWTLKQILEDMGVSSPSPS